MYAIDQNRWRSLSIFEQMGNIYSEVGRSFNAQRKGNNADMQAATARAIELFDATAGGLVVSKSPKSKEVLRAKEQFLAIVNDKNASEKSRQSLERYFMQFAIVARLNR
jgi:hypothetical protein